MNKKDISRFVLAGAGLVLLSTVPGPSLAQNSSQAPVPLQQATASPASAPRPVPKKVTGPLDYFEGLTYTDEQKAKIEEIHKQTKVRLDKVVRDNQLSPEQKDAMLQGYRRIEAGEIFQLLTPQQQKEVQQHASARRAAMKPQQQRNGSQPTTAPQSPQHTPAPQN